MSHQDQRPVTLIAAVAEDGVIGRGNTLIWRLPADMKFFRGKTKGHPVIMGRHTYESIGQPLKGRANIVLTKNKDFRPEGCSVAHSVDEALKLAVEAAAGEIFVIGGAKVYEQFMPLANKMILTHLHHTFDGDTLFPQWDLTEWKVTSELVGTMDLKNPYSYTFREYVRN